MTGAYFSSTARSNVRLRNVRLESPFHRLVILNELAGWNGLYIFFLCFCLFPTHMFVFSSTRKEALMFSIVPGKFQTIMIDTTLQPELHFA
jgi:hypothetical protein